MVSEVRWAAGRRKQECAKRKCPRVVVNTFRSSGPSEQTIPAYVSLTLVNTTRRVGLTGPRTTTYAPHAALTLVTSTLSAIAYNTTFTAANHFTLTSSTFTLRRGTITGPLYLLSLTRSVAAFVASSITLTSTHVALADRSTLLLQRSTLTISEPARNLALPGPYTLGSANPFLAVDSTIVVRTGTLSFTNVADIFLVRSKLVLAAGSQLTLTNSNMRLISCILATARATVTLSASRLVLSGTTAYTNRLVAKVTGALTILQPARNGPLKDISTQQFLASGTGTMVLTSG